MSCRRVDFNIHAAAPAIIAPPAMKAKILPIFSPLLQATHHRYQAQQKYDTHYTHDDAWDHHIKDHCHTHPRAQDYGPQDAKQSNTHCPCLLYTSLYILVDLLEKFIHCCVSSLKHLKLIL